MFIETIKDFAHCLCAIPTEDAQFEVFDLERGLTVFEGTWEELLDSEYANARIASIDLAARQGYIMCFNIN